MIRNFLFFILLCVLSEATDDFIAQKQNVLYVQNLIETEETIAKNFEKFILTEFYIPTMENLKNENYLGDSFLTTNKMGSEIDFKDVNNLKLKYAISKEGYINETETNYIALLYNRDLYRDYTTVYYDKNNSSDSFVEIKLKSNEAKNIFNLLKSGNIIEKECNTSLVNKYCNNKNNKKTIRWYNSSSKWIEYDKDKFNSGNITTSMTLDELKLESKINDLAVGSYVFISFERYLKITDDTSSGTVQILKVD